MLNNNEGCEIENEILEITRQISVKIYELKNK